MLFSLLFQWLNEYYEFNPELYKRIIMSIHSRPCALIYTIYIIIIQKFICYLSYSAVYLLYLPTYNLYVKQVFVQINSKMYSKIKKIDRQRQIKKKKKNCCGISKIINFLFSCFQICFVIFPKEKLTHNKTQKLLDTKLIDGIFFFFFCVFL